MPHEAGAALPGMQHKYRETVLFFPMAGQTCHAYCTYCFRTSCPINQRNKVADTCKNRKIFCQTFLWYVSR